MRLRAVIMALVAIASSLVATGVSAPPASAAVCSGQLIGWYPLMESRGELDLYYNSSTGMNCVVMNHGSDNWGLPVMTVASLTICRESVASTTCTPISQKQDRNVYKYYAGPVSLYGRGHCIRAYGSLDGWGNVTIGANNGGGKFC
jgi:hypothetical protein